MTTYNTGNPIGSTDVYDRYDNSENLDNFSNGPDDAYPDRFGVSRQSLQGIRNASQYVDLGPYAAGLVFTSRNQVFSYLGEFYAPGPAITLPYTTTGVGAAEIANFRSVGDAVLRQQLGIVTPQMHGAVGDGISDDTAAIQAAINSMTLGGLLFYPAGTYKVAGTLTCLSGIEHYGPNALIVQTANNTPLFKGVGLTGVGFRKLSLRGVGYTDTALTTNAASYGSGARAYGIWMETCTGVTVRDCKISNFLNAGIVPVSCTNVVLEGNEVVGTYQGVGDVKTPPGDGNFQAFGIWVYTVARDLVPPGTGNIHIIGNKCHTVAHAIFTGPFHDYVVVQDNIVYNTAQHGFYLNPSDDLIVSGNHSSPYLDGIKVQTTGAAVRANPRRISIYGNTVSGSTTGGNGINVNIIDPLDGDDKTNLLNEGVQVYGNTVSNWVGTGIHAKQCRSSSIHGNVLSSITGVGIIARHFGGTVGKNYLYAVSKECVISQPHPGQVLYLGGNEVHSAGYAGVPPDAYFSAIAAGDPRTWTASTAFGANVYCVNGVNVYNCTSQGVTAASGGPTGVGTGIVDGTAVWEFVSTLAAIDRGSFTMDGNKVTANVSDAPAFSVLMAVSPMKFRWANNILPRHIGVSSSALQASIGAVVLHDENNTHGGYVTAPTAAAATPIVGHAKRQFTSNAVPTGGGPFVVGDVAWNSTLVAGGILGWMCTVAGNPGSWRAFGHMPLVLSQAPFDAPSIANGASTTVSFAAAGAVFGDLVRVSFSASLQGLTISAYVSAADAVTVVLSNNTGAAVDLPSGTYKLEVTKTD